MNHYSDVFVSQKTTLGSSELLSVLQNNSIIVLQCKNSNNVLFIDGSCIEWTDECTQKCKNTWCVPLMHSFSGYFIVHCFEDQTVSFQNIYTEKYLGIDDQTGEIVIRSNYWHLIVCYTYRLHWHKLSNLLQKKWHVMTYFYTITFMNVFRPRGTSIVIFAKTSWNSGWKFVCSTVLCECISNAIIFKGIH